MHLKKKKKKPLTEIEKLKKAFPKYDKTKLSARYDIFGNILSIETNNKELIKILKRKGFVGFKTKKELSDLG